MYYLKGTYLLPYSTEITPTSEITPTPTLSESSCMGYFASRIRPPGSDAFVSEQLSRKGLAVSGFFLLGYKLVSSA